MTSGMNFGVASAFPMSGSGHSLPKWVVHPMSGLPPIATECRHRRRSGSLSTAEMFTISLDQLVGTQLHLARNREAEHLRSLEVDHQLVLGGRLHGQVARFFSLQDAIDI
jgi:hypothetical protein